MNKLNQKQMKNIKGEGISVGAVAMIGGVIAFIVGVFDGLIKLK